MEKLILKSGVLVLAFALVACSAKEDDKVKGLDDYTTVSGQFTENSKDALDGTGIVRLTSNLPGITSNKYIEVAGSMRLNGSVAVVMNSDDMALPDGKGVIFQMYRGNDLNKTQPSARILVQGVGVAVSDVRLAYINANDFDVIVEVHNTPTSTRILVWRKELATFTIGSADVDTANAQHLASGFPIGSGQGIFTGLKINNAKITAAQLGDAKVVLP